MMHRIGLEKYTFYVKLLFCSLMLYRAKKMSKMEIKNIGQLGLASNEVTSKMKINMLRILHINLARSQRIKQQIVTMNHNPSA